MVAEKDGTTDRARWRVMYYQMRSLSTIVFQNVLQGIIIYNPAAYANIEDWGFCNCVPMRTGSLCMCRKYACECKCTIPLCSVYNGQHLSAEMSPADCIFTSILWQIVQRHSLLEQLFAHLQLGYEIQPEVTAEKSLFIEKIWGRSQMMISKAFSENTGLFFSALISVSSELGN